MKYKPVWLPAVRQMLEERRGEWPEISKATRVKYRTIQNLVQGQVRSPNVEAVERLYQYLGGGEDE